MPENNSKITLVECPRDAMQGWKNIIPTEKKIEYLNALLKVGFDVLDFGSFVSPKAIPQMADTKDVVRKLLLSNSRSRLLAIVANTRGAGEAAAYDEISYLGFPFSISETFQQRNTNSSMAQSLERVQEIQDICASTRKKLVIYISMGFGNPYGDPWSEEIVHEWVEKFVSLGIKTISIADTVGLATPEQIEKIMKHLVPSLPDIELGVHLHSRPDNRAAKIDAAWNSNCTRYDGALKGIGGCPMANDELVGNIDTEWLIAHLEAKGHQFSIDKEALAHASRLATEIFV
jgi:Isopropylmalate/homocitrate/citramalate synthases